MSVIVGSKRITIPFPATGSRQIRLNGSWSSVLLVLVALLVSGLMLLTPIYLVLRALELGTGALDVLFKVSTVEAFGRTALLAAAVTLGSVVIAVPLAWLTTATDLPGRRYWFVATALPLVLPSYVAAYLFISIFGPVGMLQDMLVPLGITRLPSVYGFFGAFVVLTLLSYPYILLSVRVAYRRLDPSLVEAARSLGYTPRQAFWRVTLPHLRPAIVAGGLLVALYVLRDFGAVSMLRYNTFTRIIFVQYQSFSSRSTVAVLSLVLVAMTMLLLYLDLRTRGRGRYERQSAGCAREAELVTLGLWKWPALLFVGTMVFFSLILPALGLGYWLLRGIAGGAALASLWEPALGSLSAAGIAAVVTVIAALPVAILSTRRQTRLSQAVERITYAGFALPGIVIALALVFFGINYARPLYQTLPLLIGAYVVLFIPQAVGTARTSLLQVSSHLEEAGRSLGRTKIAVFRRVTLPLVTPGILAGAALVFLTVMKELPATLILSPLGFRTLPMSVWSSISEAYFAQAAAPSLLLILLSSLPLAFLTLRDR
ncbi:MAG: iron ABC transporter permease [Anaerolineae bacterium]|nr:iron ABC transporter permease [Anaerolineae bacterium]